MYTLEIKNTLTFKSGESRKISTYVTQSNENKKGFKVELPYGITSANKFQLKAKAETAWKAFTTGVGKEEIKNVVESGVFLTPETVQNLITTINEKTPEVLEEMLIQSKITSESIYSSIVKFLAKNPDRELYITSKLVEDGFDLNSTDYRERKKIGSRKTQLFSSYNAKKITFDLGLEKLIAKGEQETKNSYDSSISRLAWRLGERGVNAIVSINVQRVSAERMNCTIKTSTDEILNCYSIIASGEIQQPHIRYIIS